MDRKVEEAAPHPCGACPWRTENQGKRHQHGFYTKKNLRRLWAGLRRGEAMTCHPTDPRMAEFDGYEKCADASKTKECTGSIILVQRELQRAADICERPEVETDGFKVYRREHPKGLTIDGIMENISRTLYGGVPLIGGRPMARPDLNEPGIGHPDLEPWEGRE